MTHPSGKPVRRWLAARWRAARTHGLGLGQQVFIFYALIVVLVIGSGVVAAVIVADRLVNQAAEEQMESVAWTVASMPEVVSALDGSGPTTGLQPLAEQVQDQADVLFVVITDPDGTRLTHPNPDAIGEKFIGTIDEAQAGGVVIETYEGHLDRSLRAVVPVFGGDGNEVIGLVAVGVQVDRKRDALSDAFPLLFGAAGFSLSVAAAGSWWITRRLDRQTFGMRKAQLARVYSHHDAVLHAIREGLVVVDADGIVVLINDAAQELLGVGPEAEGRPVVELPVTGDLAAILAAGTEVDDKVTLAGERLVVVSQVPVGGHPGPDDAKRRDQEAGSNASLGTAVTLRDHSEMMVLADELSATRSLADGLRAQVHESANRLHTIVMLVELGDTDAAVELATAEVRAKKELTNRLVSQLQDSTLVALLLGKFAEAERRSVELVVPPDSHLAGEWSEPQDLVTVVGNLVDNAMDAALAGPRTPSRVEVMIREEATEDLVAATAPAEVGPTSAAEPDSHPGSLIIEVRDSGNGFSPEALQRALEPGWSSKPVDPDRRHGRGIGMALVAQVVARHGGTIEFGNAPANGDGDNQSLGGAVVVVRLPSGGDGDSY